MNNAYVLTVFIAGSIFVQIGLFLAIRFTVTGTWPLGKSATKKDKMLWIEAAVILESVGVGWFFPAIFWPMMMLFALAWFLLFYTMSEKTFLPIKYLNLD